MLRLGGSRHRFCDGISRRQFLEVGALGVAGLTLADLLRLRAAAGGRSSAKSVIMLVLTGGPSHIDMYDLKPDAPAEYRGEFQPIRTVVPGFDMCEHMPLQAKIAGKLALVRSLTFPSDAHEHNMNYSGFTFSGRRPAFGSVVSRFRSAAGDRLPHYVSFPHSELVPGGWPPREEPYYAGAAHQPFRFGGQDRSTANLRLASSLTLDRLEDRRKLMGQLDTLRRDLDTRGDLAALDAFSARAFDMITSPKALEAFDIAREPDRVREKYGQSQRLGILGTWNPQNLLLARRLVEAGVSVVTVPLGWWDHHATIFKCLRDCLPILDRALVALLTDLQDRGLENDVAVCVWGEMGRTPKLESFGGVSRGHWAESGFALFAGGGLQMGRVVGCTDGRAARPRTRPYGPQNVLATLYHVLGINPSETLADHSGRPVHLLDDGEPIAELI